MVREDLIESAVTFLQDPSVATSPIDKRRAFLKSKNLTEDEINLALARAGEVPSTQNSFPSRQPEYTYQNQQPPGPLPQNYGYGPYHGGPWAQPPEPPRRDWRDWFIMGTVTAGVSYGLYTVAKHYVLPLISPPTPPQLEQDKAAIDASFTRAFTLIDQLATDTAALKTAETERRQKLDTTLEEVEAVVAELKSANKRREDENKRIMDEVRGLRDAIPKALEAWKSEGDGRLKDLGTELKSLKMLVGNRVGGGAQAVTNGPAGRPYRPGLPDFTNSNTSGSSAPRETSIPGPSYGNAVSDDARTTNPAPSSASASAPGVTVPKRDTSSPNPLDWKPNNRAAIPAWQMAAAEKSLGGGVGSGSGIRSGSAEASETVADA